LRLLFAAVTTESNVQLGPEAMKKPGFVTLASYGETKIRHFHQLYERWLDLV
jgi:hypothetical protein